MALVHPLKWSYRRCNRFARRSAANLWRAGIPGRPKKRRIHLRNAQPVNRIQRLAFFAVFCVAWFNAAVGRPVERTSAAGPTPPPVQRVLVLYSDERLLPANIIVDEAIRAAFAVGTNNRVEFYSEFLDVSRFPGEEQQQRQRDFLRDKYRERPPDLVIAVSGGALVFLVKHRADLFTGVPIVYCSVAGDPHPDLLSDARIAEVPVPDGVAPTLEMMLRLHPDTRQVAVVSGSGPRDRQMADTFRQEMTTFGNRVAFTWLTNLSMEELRGELSRLPDHTVVLYLTMFQDAAGKTFTPRQALEAFAPASRAPIYGCYDTYRRTWDCRRLDGDVRRDRPESRSVGHPHPRWRRRANRRPVGVASGGADVRLARIPAMEHQRGAIAARQRRPVQRGYVLGATLPDLFLRRFPCALRRHS